MNKRVLTASVVLGLAVLLALNYSAMVIQAQPSPDQQTSEQDQSYYETYKPETPPITIAVSSPQNNSALNDASVALDFNVSAPKALSIPEPAQVQSIQITNVSYTCDWQTENHQLYAYDSLNVSSKDERFDFLAFNTTFSNIPEGTHEIEITALAIVNTNAAMFGFTYHYSSNASIILNVNAGQPTVPNQNSDSNVDNQSDLIIDHFPNYPLLLQIGIVLTITIVIGVCLFVYHKKIAQTKKVH